MSEPVTSPAPVLAALPQQLLLLHGENEDRSSSSRLGDEYRGIGSANMPHQNANPSSISGNTDPELSESERRWLSFAKRDFPDDDPKTALAKYAEENRNTSYFYAGRDGGRCRWAADIKYFKNKSYRGIKWEEEWGPGPSLGNRKYFVARCKIPLWKIDRPLVSKEISQAIAHRSEAGWHLAPTHPRHLLKFPPEIINKILTFVLTTRPDEAVYPDTVQINQKREWTLPGYSIVCQPIFDAGGCIFTRSSLDKITCSTQQIDEKGPYTEYRRILTSPIDASVLRSSKKMSAIGSGILFGQNDFSFRMHSPCYSIGWMFFKKKNDECPTFHRPYPFKPRRDARYTQIVNDAISNIERQVPFDKLPGFVYFDQFLRFLYDIGPKNAALIKSLTFTGTVETYSRDDVPRKEDDFVVSLRLYIPFIIALCTGLQKLVLNACIQEDPEDALLRPTKSYEDALKPLLDKGICQIQTLQSLEVYCDRDYHEKIAVEDEEEEEDANATIIEDDPNEYDPTSLVDFAMPVIHQVKQRTMERKKAESEREAMKRRRQDAGFPDAEESEQGVKCDFCAGDHIWPECPNLCGFCGRFGHFHWKCKEKRLAIARERGCDGKSP